MTLSDPLLKELKGHIAKLVLGSGSCRNFGDENATVESLCHCIEAIFVKGLVRIDGFSPWRADSFAWFYQLVRKYHRIIPLAFKMGFEEALNDPKTRTPIGKTRLLIRSCLKRKCLHIPVQFQVENQDWLDSSLRVNYTSGSILGHEIFAQIFLSLIQQLSHYEFTFDISNSSFLDESWQIPNTVKIEFVPCELLGITFGFPLGFAVIAEIIEHSLAAEVSDTITVGDIMDEFNGIAVRNFYGPKIESIFKKNKAKPFMITFIKAHDYKGLLYLPAIKLYRIMGLDQEKLTYSKKDKSFEGDNKEELHEGEGKNNEPLIQGLLEEDLFMKENAETAKSCNSNYQNLLNDVEKPQSIAEQIFEDEENLIDIDLGPCLTESELGMKSQTASSFNPMSNHSKPFSNSDSKADLSTDSQSANENESKYVDDNIPCIV